MKLQICSTFDKAAAAYNAPFFVPALGQAVRAFTDQVNKAEAGNTMFEHSSDFELYHLGSFDDANSSFELLPSASLLTTGAIVSTRFVKE